MKVLLFSWFLLFGFLLEAQSSNQLIVFLSDGNASLQFKEKKLGELKAYTSANEIELIVKEAKNGLPEGVPFTPSFYFQNYRGRSMYSGRYLTMDRLINFMRTAKYSPRKISENKKEGLPIWEKEGAVIGTPLKVTQLQGASEKIKDQKAFIKEAKEIIGKSTQDFKASAFYDLPMEARLFYTNYYPYLSEDGKFYISTEIFSMFSCIEPIFKSSKPFEGTWEDWQEVFEKAAKSTEQEVKSQLSNLTFGDAIEFIPSQIKRKTWEGLGLAIPQKSDSDKQEIKLKTLPKVWQFKSALPDGSPLVQFNFGAPVDHYSGEAKEMKMQMQLQKGNTLKGAFGHVVVKTSTITMGDEGLDDHIYEDYLKVFEFPNATYDFKVTKAPEKWDFHEIQPIELEGSFEMKGKKVKLKSSGMVEVVLDEENQPVLRVNGSFKLKLKELFGINGPDGPSPAKDELDFQLNFLLKSAKKVSMLSEDLYANQVSEESIEKPEDEYIKWFARTKLYKAKGSFEEWTVKSFDLPYGDFSEVKAEIEIAISSLSERSKLLVKHLKAEEYFDIEKYQTATIFVNGAKKQTDGKYKANADAFIKGTKAPIILTFEVLDDKKLLVKGNAQVERETFKIGTSKKAQSISKLVELEFQTSFKGSF